MFIVYKKKKDAHIARLMLLTIYTMHPTPHPVLLVTQFSPQYTKHKDSALQDKLFFLSDSQKQ